MNVGQFLSAAPCPFVSLSVQFVQLSASVFVLLQFAVRCGPLHHAHVLLSALQSRT
jgi:hypothetical protein